MNCTFIEFQNKIYTSVKTLVSLSGHPGPNYGFYEIMDSYGNTHSMFCYDFNYSTSPINYTAFRALDPTKRADFADFIWEKGKVIKDLRGIFNSKTNPIMVNTNGGPLTITFPISTPQNPGHVYNVYSGVDAVIVNVSIGDSKCECGAHKVGSKMHSSWCNLKELS